MRPSHSVLRLAVVAALFSAPIHAAETPPAKANAKTFLAVPFAASGDAPDWMGVAIAETLTDLVVQSNADNFLTLKQLDAVLRRRQERLNDARVAQSALELAHVVGATELLAGTVTLKGDQLTISGRWTRVSDGTLVKEATLEGAKANIATIAFDFGEKLLGTKIAAGPMTKSSKAMEMVSKCAIELDRQSVGPRARVVLTGERLESAESTCQGALNADHKLALAHAYEAVLLALHNRYPDARKEAALAQTFKRYVPMAPLADSFAARRSGDVAAARAALETAVHERPGFLHAIGYLAEEQEDLNQNQAALDWWTAYLARAPGHPFATARAGRALARLGKPQDGIALTHKALERSPNDPELLIELASRHIDANEFDKAEAILLNVEKVTPRRPLAWLRLGYLYQRQGKLPQATEQFKSSIKQGTDDDQARLRAVAYADLAQIAGQENKFDDALDALKGAAKEGMHKLPCDSAELSKYKGKAPFDRVCKDAEKQPGGLVDDEDVVGVDVVQ
jgi:tetratricopeptide (TPR) repeat protein